ncbi:MAG: hypothetical protein K2H23_08980 [Oscillospiraceae bacterium]|nr:hypothetical protein [Oscillospiraceae bacterium]
MKKKITFILKMGLTFIVGFFAFFGLLCFFKIIAEIRADSSKIAEIQLSINYSKYNINDDRGGLLVISGSGFVLKEIVDSFEDIEAIYISEGILGIEPNAFGDIDNLTTLVLPYEIYSNKMDIPMQTDVLFIEDNEYMDFLEPYI